MEMLRTLLVVQSLQDPESTAGIMVLDTSTLLSVDSHKALAVLAADTKQVIWCFISSTLFDCHASTAHGAIYELPDCSI
jgi:hypothetical protein